MQFRVVIPETGVKAGQTIRIRCLDNTEANVQVPDGLGPGDSFIFELSADQLNNHEALLDTIRNKTDATDIDDVVHSTKSFLERDVSNVTDFALALLVSLIIGSGIIIGFFLGILYATRSSAGGEPLQYESQQ